MDLDDYCFYFWNKQKIWSRKTCSRKTHHKLSAVYLIIVCKHGTKSINIQKLLTFVQYNQNQNHLEMLTLRFLLWLIPNKLQRSQLAQSKLTARASFGPFWFCFLISVWARKPIIGKSSSYQYGHHWPVQCTADGSSMNVLSKFWPLMSFVVATIKSYFMPSWNITHAP